MILLDIIICLKNEVNLGNECIGERIGQFLCGHNIQEILIKKSLDVEINKKKYTAYASRLDSGIILYFVENTKYKEISSEYYLSKSVVALAFFDNREELKHDTTDEKDAQLAVMVENTLQDWALTTTGIFKKLNDGKYIIVFEERHLRKFIEDKFKILDSIHKIKANEYRCATVSIGIGRGAENIYEAEKMAKSALDMALGRGGDQVVIKKGHSYQFFGGTSKGIEKRSKVRTRIVASTLKEQILSSDCVLIMGHKSSDLDCIGAAVGIWNVASNAIKSPVYIVVNKETCLAKGTILSIEETISNNMFISPERAKSMVTEKTLLVVVDTHAIDFLESKELYEMCNRVVVIDHHRMTVKHINNAVIFYHEPFASSTSEMVTELIQYMGDKNLKKFESECLLAGIMLDTKNFVLKTGVRTFEAAAYLKRKGADPIGVKKMFANPIGMYKIKYELISKAEIIKNCAIAYVEKIDDDERIACAQAADELLDVKGIKASFVLFPFGKGISISARSMGEVNVQLIMEAMGGGGHQNMAGAQVEDISFESAIERLKSIINNID